MKEEILHEDLLYIADSIRDNILKFCNSTILITGHAGFLGYYLTVFLAQQAETLNIQILCVDNLALGKPVWQKQLEGNSHCKFFAMGVEEISVETIPELTQVNYVIHMASIASPVYYRLHPMETFQANVRGLERFGNLFIEGELPLLKRLLCLSSSEIYGNPDTDHIPTKEDYVGLVSCTGPRACYDEAKRVCETLCWIYSEHYGMPISIVRPFNVYGPGMRINDKRLPADLASCVIEDKDIVIYSDGTPTRAFCYIADAIVGILKVLLYTNNDTFNIGNAQLEMSVLQFAKTYKKVGQQLLGYKGDIVYQTHTDQFYLSNNPQHRCPDITKAIDLLEYKPQISLEEGIRRYLLFLKG